MIGRLACSQLVEPAVAKLAESLDRYLPADELSFACCCMNRLFLRSMRRRYNGQVGVLLHPRFQLVHVAGAQVVSVAHDHIAVVDDVGHVGGWRFLFWAEKGF